MNGINVGKQRFRDGAGHTVGSTKEQDSSLQLGLNSFWTKAELNTGLTAIGLKPFFLFPG